MADQLPIIIIIFYFFANITLTDHGQTQALRKATQVWKRSEARIYENMLPKKVSTELEFNSTGDLKGAKGRCQGKNLGTSNGRLR